MADTTFGVLGGGSVPRRPKRVTRTGLALVHENEIVYPAAGGEAEAIQAVEDAGTTVQVFFPVQVELREVAPRSSTAGDGTGGEAEERTLRAVAAVLSDG
ncbi:hypothetical protein C882_1769 [Caenispirillum salinarum AK4]|uniref:Uncharacterized protein n=1 Tax=Caenispirillum salinarum AK4 TaxID=1238182 RepID=K9GQ50_9PROT|nr:hypothetical protein [Caenispirillum salinarum]EKV27267.1 hypothetical protein C882_1769 [Caenispirillum salinarum AK4]